MTDRELEEIEANARKVAYDWRNNGPPFTETGNTMHEFIYFKVPILVAEIRRLKELKEKE